MRCVQASRKGLTLLFNSLSSPRRGADDHPFVSALHENIHPTSVAAGVLPSVGSLFGDTALDHSNVVKHLHVHGSNFKGLEFVVAGFQIAQKAFAG